MRSVPTKGNVEPRLALGELFLTKYNSVDAQKTFDDLLHDNPSQPRALLGQAQRLIADQQPRCLIP